MLNAAVDNRQRKKKGGFIISRGKYLCFKFSILCPLEKDIQSLIESSTENSGEA